MLFVVAAPLRAEPGLNLVAPDTDILARRSLAAGMGRQGQQIAQSQATPAVPTASFGVLAGSGVDSTLRFGLIAPFSGANKDFASELRLGAETAFAAANEAGGVNGKALRLVAADDGYDPVRTPDVARSLVEKEKVFGFLSNFGTATSSAILPYVLDHKLIFFGAFSGAGMLRQQPPDRYVFNYRASYAEETEAVVRYLVKVRRLRPEQIAVFAQDDAFGDAGYQGVEKALRALDNVGTGSILHLRYARNSIDVAAAIETLGKRRNAVTTSTRTVRERIASTASAPPGPSAKEGEPDVNASPIEKPKAQYRERKVSFVRSEVGIKAVVMVATYRAAAKFIEKARELYPDMIFTNVSAVGSNNFAEELKLLGPRYCKDIIVTQVVPDPNGYSSLALEFKAALARHFPAERVDFVSFESYINAKILLEGLRKAGPQPDSDKVVTALEGLHGLDIGVAAPVEFGASEHQAVHKVWGTQLDEEGRYHTIGLD